MYKGSEKNCFKKIGRKVKKKKNEKEKGGIEQHEDTKSFIRWNVLDVLCPEKPTFFPKLYQ